MRRGKPDPVARLLITEAVTTWVPTALAWTLIAVSLVLDAVGFLAEAVAAIGVILGLLGLAVWAVIVPTLRDREGSPLSRRMTGLVAVGWLVLLVVPFGMRLFPGSALATFALTPEAHAPLPVGTGHFDLVIDAQLPPSTDHQTRALHYDFALVDDDGHSLHYAGDLGDRWQTRRVGRRGTAPVHLEHLSTSHDVDHPVGGPLRVEHVSVTGVPAASLAASVYRHRLPSTPWLALGALAFATAALVLDLRRRPDETPMLALVTATAATTMVIFCTSAAGHPGLRQVFGSMIVGAIAAVPAAGLAAWMARHTRWARVTSRRAR